MQVILKDSDGNGHSQELPLEIAPEYLSFDTGQGTKVFFAEIEPRVYAVSHFTSSNNESKKEK